MYFPWSRPDEEGAPLGNLDNRFGALFELRRLQWPKYEALADSKRFNQGIAGFFDHVLLQNYSQFCEDTRIRTGNAVRIVQRCSSEGAVTLLDAALLDGIDILIIVSFDSQRTGQHPNERELAAIRGFLDDPGHTLFVCPHHDIGSVDGIPSDEVLKAQEAEFRHHGDLGIPGQQRLGGFARSMLRDLGVPMSNDFGLRPAKIFCRASALFIFTRTCRTLRCWATVLKSWMFWCNNRSIWRRPRIRLLSKDGRPSMRCCNPNPTFSLVDCSYATLQFGPLRMAGLAACVSSGQTSLGWAKRNSMSREEHR
jgi:hypothetical protein